MSQKSDVQISLHQLKYHLPDDSIARYPQSQRGQSKLLVFKDKSIIDEGFPQIGNYLPKSSLLVFNDTKVINARLTFYKSTGSKIEIFCLEPIMPKEINEVFLAKNEVVWSCLVGNLKRWKENEILEAIVDFDGVSVKVTAELLQRNGLSNSVRLAWNSDLFSFSEILERLGTLPIPPYLERPTEELDKDRYQTVYSQNRGSVAAPTAGLHFTQPLLHDLQGKNHALRYLTLHVGAGTFKPIKEEDISKHEMHKELFVVDRFLVAELLSHSRPVVAIGTTSVRTLESLYWLGVRLISGDVSMHVPQWFPYEFSEKEPSVSEALSALLDFLDSKLLSAIEASTAILIKPGYKFKIVDVLITNFHQPESTLLLLVSAFIGYKNCMDIYAHAIHKGYKFLSYGDSSILFPHV